MVESFAARGTEQLVVGMAHRGRLNILNAVFDKPLAAICAEMRSEGRFAAQRRGRAGRYHLGFDTTVEINLPEIQTGNLDGGDAVADEDDPLRRRRRRRRRRWISPWRRIRAISRL